MNFGAPFTAGSTGLFGAPAAAAPAFGTPTFGAPAATAQPFAFGAPTTTAFAPTATQPTFGAPAGGIFGAQPTTATGQPGGLFGGLRTATAGVGAAPTNLFGTTAAPGAMGGGLFGSVQTAQPAFGAFTGAAMPKGTGSLKFGTTTVKDSNITSQFFSITAMEAYSQKSFEELRYEDYAEGRKGNTGGASPFATQSAGGIFSAPAAQSPFGLTAAPAAAQPSFGNLFASTPSASTGLFGAPAAAAPATGNLFGGTSTSLFAAPTATSAFGAPATGTTGFASFGIASSLVF
eukprot:TRINITY_DN1525_c0_g1_i6.p2 TRINITY_DN1525_c0_g1~~TRINITY_DN1525_c0_g1_i6.p2  ORF type:complete len:309 (+),score=73.66 TRINITY_DN1525_c0_g1_i6:59-928(+)